MTTSIDTQNAPRKTPWTVKVALFFDYGRLIALGLVAFVPGMYFLIALTSLNTFRVFFFEAPFSITHGEIAYVEGTSINIGRAYSSRSNEIFEYGYQYKVGGETLKGVAYDRGVPTDVKVGTQLKIEYRIEKPHWSRLHSWAKVEKPDWSSPGHWSTVEEPDWSRHANFGMNMAPLEQSIAPAFFSLIGGILLYVGIRRGLRNVDLLTNGVVTWGKAAEETSPHTQNALYRSYKFKTHQGVAITARVANAWDRRAPRLRDNELLVYDYRRPQKAVSFRLLSKSVQKALTETAQVKSPTSMFESLGKIGEIDEIEKIVISRPKPEKSASFKSVPLNFCILACLAAVGVFEFNLLLLHFPDEVILIGVKQLTCGVVALGLGGLLISPPLSGKPTPQPLVKARPIKKVFAALIIVAGSLLTVASMAGLLYVGYLEFSR
jgi:hypothetical protein